MTKNVTVVKAASVQVTQTTSDLGLGALTSW
jgi:hypothetical protein